MTLNDFCAYIGFKAVWALMALACNEWLNGVGRLGARAVSYVQESPMLAVKNYFPSI